MRRWWVVFTKELVDNLRDRRSILTALLLGPIFGPALLLFITRTSVNVIKDELDKPLELPVIGQQYAPNLVHFLEDNDVIVQPGPTDPKAAVASGDLKLVLEIPAGYGDDFVKGDPATVHLYVDDSDRNNNKFVKRATALLEGYSRQQGALRLLARGVSPTVTVAVVVDEVDVSTAQARAAVFLSMIPYFVIIASLMGGFYLAADSTAGERERGSLEPLMTTPTTRAELVLGKLGATMVYAALSLALTLTSYFTSFNYMPLEELGMSATLDPIAGLRIYGVALPFVFLGAALMVSIASFSRTYKEAQTYLSFVTMIPILPMMYTLFSTPKLALWQMIVPVLSQHLLVNSLLRGEAVEPLFVFGSIVSTIVYGFLLSGFAMWLYRRERILGS